tara:strand:+ start:21208 stop:22152 length:945 start_codon:yes stop_codon:yes gene_type:complete
MDSKYLITGAGGFVGSALLPVLGRRVSVVIGTCAHHGVRSYNLRINRSTDFTDCLENIDCVIHLAARVHVMNDGDVDLLQAYRDVNVEGTLNLARQAAAAGVRRFVFVSSIKVNGENTNGRPLFNECDAPNPLDAYGISKLEAEIGLRELATSTGLEVVIIRPPLVYGAGVRANFLSLLKLADSRIPLPFSLVSNVRSMIYVENLVDFIILCCTHPKATSQTFLVADQKSLSLAELMTLIRTSMGRKTQLWPLPSFLFRLFGVILGKSKIVDRLVGNLEVDSSYAMKLLNWSPPFSVEQGIKVTVDAFIQGDRR